MQKANYVFLYAAAPNMGVPQCDLTIDAAEPLLAPAVSFCRTTCWAAQVDCLPTCKKEGEEPANPPIRALDYVLTRYRHAKLNVRAHAPAAPAACRASSLAMSSSAFIVQAAQGRASTCKKVLRRA